MQAERKWAYISEAYEAKRFDFQESVNNLGQKCIILEGEFQRANASNRNRRVYSENLLRRETAKLQSIIDSRNGLPMGMDHPIPDNTPESLIRVQRVDLLNSCALLRALTMPNDIVYGKSEVLSGDFGTGDKLTSLINHGWKPAVSSRGLGGNPVPGINGLIMVPEDYQMVTYDFVSNPSTHNAILEQTVMEEIAFLESQTISKRSLYEVMIDLKSKEFLKK